MSRTLVSLHDHATTVGQDISTLEAAREWVAAAWQHNLPVVVQAVAPDWPGSEANRADGLSAKPLALVHWYSCAMEGGRPERWHLFAELAEGYRRITGRQLARREPRHPAIDRLAPECDIPPEVFMVTAGLSRRELQGYYLIAKWQRQVAEAITLRGGGEVVIENLHLGHELEDERFKANLGPLPKAGWRIIGVLTYGSMPGYGYLLLATRAAEASDAVAEARAWPLQSYEAWDMLRKLENRGPLPLLSPEGPTRPEGPTGTS